MIQERQLNGPQTTGRELSEPQPSPSSGFVASTTPSVPMRDGVNLLADVHRPDADGTIPGA